MAGLVSIIIPCYNALPFLKETLTSVFNQKYANIEVIVVDDGSTDGSYEYVQSLNQLNLTLVKNKRKGACAARNYGLELAKGDYIQFLDADDLLETNKIAQQMDLAKTFGEQFVFSCKWKRFWDDINKAAETSQVIDKDYDKPYFWLRDSWLGGGMTAVHSWLVPRKIIDKAGIWNESLSINQDGEFFCRILLQANGIKFCDSTTVYYRSGNPNSISQFQNNSYAKAQSLLNSYSLYKDHVINSGYLEQLKEGLGHNFLMFMYQFHGKYNDLYSLAEQEFEILGYQKMWPVGGERFKSLARIIGFKRALKIKSVFIK